MGNEWNRVAGMGTKGFMGIKKNKYMVWCRERKCGEEKKWIK